MARKLIQVTQEDIDNARHELSAVGPITALPTECCPVAQALRREFNVPRGAVRAGDDGIRVANKPFYSLPDKYFVAMRHIPYAVDEFMRKFDAWDRAEPFEFEIDTVEPTPTL